MKHRWITLLAAIAAAGAAGAASAAPLAGQRVASEAKWIAHADLQQLKQTEIGTYLLRRMSQPEVDAKLAAFKVIFNFDPRTDLDDVTAYGEGRGENDAAVLLRGRFDGERLLTLLRANDTYAGTTYNDHSVHSWIDDKEQARAKAAGDTPKRQYGALYSDGTLVMSDRRENVLAALDVLDGLRPNAKASGRFAGLRPERLDALNDAPFFLAVADTAGIADLDPNAAILKQTRSAAFSLGEVGANVIASLDLSARDAETASSIRMLAQGMIGLMALQTEENPQLAALAKTAQVELEGDLVSVRIAYPVQEMIRLIETQKGLNWTP